MIAFLTDRLRSVRYAMSGLIYVLRSQHNARVHLGITLAVIAAGYWFGLNRAEWLWMALAIALVWIAEVMNTGFEYLCDVVSPEFSKSVEKAKDIAAGAVLIASVFALITGVIVFLPYVS